MKLELKVTPFAILNKQSNQMNPDSQYKSKNGKQSLKTFYPEMNILPLKMQISEPN